MNEDEIRRLISAHGPRAAFTMVLEEFPSSATREFEDRAVDLAQYLEGHESLFEDTLMQEPHLSEDLRFAAFFCLATRYRRRKDRSKLEELLRKAGHFRDRGMFWHMDSMALLLSGDDKDLKRALRSAKEALQLLPDHPGLLHNLAACVVQLREEGVDLPGADQDEQAAREALERAIGRLPKYAKFHATLGRLEAIGGDFKAARASIREAIDLEDSNHRDYGVRLADYNGFLSGVQLREAEHRLTQQTSQTVAEITATTHAVAAEIKATKDEVKQFASDAQRRNLELLGFFTAVIALIVGTLGLTRRQPAAEAVQLITALAGAVLFAFAGLGILLWDGDGDADTRVQRTRVAALATMGLAVMLFAMLAVPRLMNL